MGFHSATDMITFSKPAKTKKAFSKKLEEGNWDSITTKQLKKYTDAKEDFSDVKLIVNGVLKNEIELING